MNRTIDADGRATVTGYVRYVSDTTCHTDCDFCKVIANKLTCILYAESISLERADQCVRDNLRFKVFVVVRGSSLLVEEECEVHAAEIKELVQEVCSHTYSSAELILRQGLLEMRVQRPGCMAVADWAALVKEWTNE